MMGDRAFREVGPADVARLNADYRVLWSNCDLDIRICSSGDRVELEFVTLREHGGDGFTPVASTGVATGRAVARILCGLHQAWFVTNGHEALPYGRMRCYLLAPIP